ncbi:TetR/AcrR family transcriptional regulator [Phenylobacterium sp.]|uniref:TetR/AcrR family transcriptional regulator n=1 Tax=Phenylobacterium sp. TaxID=1871053 RepID=UPI00262C6EB5|nr:TetR/AcrR family transcriptional regulator [Phenylobacterium sp.]
MPKISEARKSERKRQILLASARRFARQGFAETTILDICREAGLSPGAVYTYFDSKEAIIAAMAELGAQQSAARMDAARSGLDPLTRLRMFLSEFSRPEAAQVNQYDLRIWAEAIGNAGLRSIYLRSRAQLIEALGDIAQPLAARRGVDPGLLAELIAAVAIGSEVRKAIEPEADVLPVLGVLFALLASGRPTTDDGPAQADA